LLHLHAVNAKEEITRRQKINGQRLTNWSLVNTVDFAESILYIKRPNKEFFLKGVKQKQVALTNDFAGQ